MSWSKPSEQTALGADELGIAFRINLRLGRFIVRRWDDPRLGDDEVLNWVTQRAHPRCDNEFSRLYVRNADQ
jgi:hypothetical protein